MARRLLLFSFFEAGQASRLGRGLGSVGCGVEGKARQVRMRDTAVEIGLIAEAQGSARVTSGGTVVQSSVYGPAQARYSRHEEFDSLSVEVKYNLLAAGSSSADLVKEEREGSRLLRSTLLACIDVKFNPRMLVVIEVSVLRADGAALATALNACSLALMDSGIPLLYYPMALSCCITAQNASSSSSSTSSPTKATLNTTADLEDKAECCVTFAFRRSSDNKSYNIVLTSCAGVLSPSHLEDAWNEVLGSADQLADLFKRGIRG